MHTCMLKSSKFYAKRLLFKEPREWWSCMDCRGACMPIFLTLPVLTICAAFSLCTQSTRMWRGLLHSDQPLVRWSDQLSTGTRWGRRRMQSRSEPCSFSAWISHCTLAEPPTEGLFIHSIQSKCSLVNRRFSHYSELLKRICFWEQLWRLNY